MGVTKTNTSATLNFKTKQEKKYPSQRGEECLEGICLFIPNL